MTSPTLTIYLRGIAIGLLLAVIVVAVTLWISFTVSGVNVELVPAVPPTALPTF